jgi:hypothetical protein
MFLGSPLGGEADSKLALWPALIRAQILFVKVLFCDLITSQMPTSNYHEEKVVRDHDCR